MQHIPSPWRHGRLVARPFTDMRIKHDKQLSGPNRQCTTTNAIPAAAWVSLQERTSTHLQNTPWGSAHNLGHVLPTQNARAARRKAGCQWRLRNVARGSLPLLHKHSHSMCCRNKTETGIPQQINSSAQLKAGVHG